MRPCASFTKMQGAGNDFVVLDETQGRLGLTPAHYRFWATATLAWAPIRSHCAALTAPGIDFEYVIHNADGAEVDSAAMAPAALPALCATGA